MGGKKAKGSNDAVVQEQRAQADEARIKEDQRKARIDAGKLNIQRAFQGSPVMATRQVAKTRQVANPAYSATATTGGDYATPPADPYTQTATTGGDYATPYTQTATTGGDYATPKATVDPYMDETYYEDETYDTGKVAGGFNDKFYKNYGQAVSDYYLPQVNKQYADAGEELTYRLGRSGNLRSEAAADETADLSSQYDLNKANVKVKADAAETDLRNTVSGQRSKIETALQASEDPTQASNQALAAVRDISLQQPDLSPLGAIFNVATIGGANFLRGAQNAKYAAAFPEGTLPGYKAKVIG